MKDGLMVRLIAFRYPLVLAWLLHGLFSATLCAQSLNLGMTHHTWGMEDGLPDQVIQAIAQTPDGYLWLGTPHGLVTFDGFKFVTVAAPTLHEFGVSCILVAKDGTLWVGSVGGGVTHLTSQSAMHFGPPEGLQALTTRALYQSDDGTIWAGTDSGLYKLVRGKFNFVEGFGHQNVTAMLSDGSDGFWIAGGNLIHYQHGMFAAVPLPPLRSVIRSLARAPDGGLWVGALGRLMERKPDGRIQISRTVHADVRALCFDKSGRLWIGTIGDGALARLQDGSIVRELAPNEPDRGAIRALLNTRDGDLWVGAHAGLIRLSHTGMDSVKVSNSRTADFGSVFLDRDDSVWLSAGNVIRYTGGEDRVVELPLPRGVQIRAVFRDSSRAFWVGTAANGAYRLVDGRVTAHLLGSIAITSFLEAQDGSVWIGNDHGLARWSHGTCLSFPYRENVPMGTVKAMTLGPSGDVWIATPAGLFLFHNNKYVRPDVTGKLASYRVWSLYAGPDGSLWIGAGTGLYLWRDGSLTHIDLSKSLSQSQAVISILVDAKGRFLIAQPTAVFRITKDDLEQSIAGSRNAGPDGIEVAHLLTTPETFAVGSETGAELYSEIPGVASADRQGGAWYATYEGLLHIAASPLSQHDVPPPLKIEKVLVDGTVVSGKGPIILPASAHNIQLQATPILLSGSPGLVLRRRLLGFDDKWSELVPGSSSSYGRLAPGQYTFAVEAYWPGMNKVSSAQIIIVQQSAIYRRKPFIVGCCVLAAILVWLLYRFRIHQMKLRFRAVADERTRVAREIHDTLLQGCIGAVSLLEALEISHVQSREDDRQTAQEHRWLTIVQCVREQFSETIKEAREAIWNLRNADDERPLDEALRDTLERLTSRAGVETSFRAQGDTIPIAPRLQHEIIMSAREAIMNAVSHGHPEAIDVRLSFDSGVVTVSVCDDGIGFAPDAVQLTESDHFGLSSMRDRMRKFRGSAVIESEPGQGTKVRLSVPLEGSHVRYKH